MIQQSIKQSPCFSLLKLSMALCFFIFFFVLLSTQSLLGQEISHKRTLFSLGITAPTDDFAETETGDIRSGFAGKGIAVGIAKYYPTKTKGLSMMWGIDVMANPYSQDGKERFEDLSSNIDEVHYPIYFNVPVRAGLEYRLSPSPSLELFGNGGLALNFQKRTNMVISWTNTDSERTTTFNFATGFGGYIGTGTLINGKTTIGLDYYMLGKHRMKAKWEEGSSSGNFLTEKFAITMVKVYVAFPFGKTKER